MLDPRAHRCRFGRIYRAAGFLPSFFLFHLFVQMISVSVQMEGGVCMRMPQWGCLYFK